MHTILRNHGDGRPAGTIFLRQAWTLSAAAIWLKIAERLALWAERRRQRRALARLDDRMLQDIGISRADALYEARKPFWRD